MLATDFGSEISTVGFGLSKTVFPAFGGIGAFAAFLDFRSTKRKTSAVRRSGDTAARGDGASGSDGPGANPFRNTLGIQFE